MNPQWINYENNTQLYTHYSISHSHNNFNTIQFRGYNHNFIIASKKLFLLYFKNIIHNVPAHGCKEPDECFISEQNKTIFIIEKKFQKYNGSTCEKIQTPDFKLWHLKKLIPKYKIIYIYVLSDWFKHNCIHELKYLHYKKIPVFWGSSPYYKKNIIKFIHNNL